MNANANFTQDLVFIEEAFERLLLDYDRVFSAMGIPACLWRRTGEIYKVGFVSDTYSIFFVTENPLQGNKEFADLVGVDVTRLRDVSSCVVAEAPPSIQIPLGCRGGYVSMN